jgi:death-on-curing protein
VSIRFLTTAEVLYLHQRILAVSGGTPGIRELAIVQSSVAQPMASFDGADLYPDVVAKAAALCFSLVRGHGFIDGNKRIGHASLEAFLQLNGFLLEAATPEQETIFLALAAGSLGRIEFETWLRAHVAHG